jgi:hypothetical protein
MAKPGDSKYVRQFPFASNYTKRPSQVIFSSLRQSWLSTSIEFKAAPIIDFGGLRAIRRSRQNPDNLGDFFDSPISQK